ncbi:MAG: hypothetical protein AB7S26_31785 [Sandaracinaceae bacterium]
MRRALALTLALLGGCYGNHGADAGPIETSDAGMSRFEGRWLLRADLEAARYELAADHRVIRECQTHRDRAIGRVVRDADGVSCPFVGPWQSRNMGELAIDCFGDDSGARTVVMLVAWSGPAPTVTLEKVDGETTGWTLVPTEWLPCDAFPDECATACR